MTQFTKNLSPFAREYGLSDESGIPALLPIVVPTVSIDDCSEFAARTYPTYYGLASMAATAAVYGLVGLQAGTRPILVKQFTNYRVDATALRIFTSSVDPRTANQATGTLVRGMDRGGGGRTASVFTGTTAALIYGWSVYDLTTTTENEIETNLDLLLRPGESIWMVGGVVNIIIGATFRWVECTYPLTGNPPVI